LRKSKKISFFVILILLGISINIGEVKAAKTMNVDASADTYVSSNAPTLNYGTNLYIDVGFATGFTHNFTAYFSFSLSNLPGVFLGAEISLRIVADNETVRKVFEVYLIETSWNEREITYNNRPSLGAFMTYFNVTTDGIYSLDVSDFVSGRNTLSICLLPVNTTYDESIQINSRENAFYNPELTWTYDDTENPTLKIVIVVIVIASVLGAVGGGYFLYKKRMDRPYSPEPETPFEKGLPTRRQRKTDKLCWYCDKSVPEGFNVCPNCGAALE